MKKLIVLLLLVSVVFSQLPEQLQDMNCEERADGYVYCPQISLALDMPIMFTDDITCYSTEATSCSYDCATVVNLGCVTFFNMTQEYTFQAKYVKAQAGSNESETIYENVTLPTGYQFIASVKEDIVDYSKCLKEFRPPGNEFFNESVLVITCPVNNSHATVSSAIIMDWFMPAIRIEEMEVQEVPGILGLILDNWLYIVLILVIVLIAFWALKPKK